MSVPLPLLHALEVERQKKSRGTLNSAHAVTSSEGQFDALVDVAQLVLQQLKRRSVPEGLELDDLDPKRLAETVHNRIATLDELSDPSAATSELRARQQSLGTLRGRKPGRLLRTAAALAEGVASECRERICADIDRAAGTAPHRAGEILGQVRNDLRAFEIPEPDGESFVQLSRAVRALSDLVQHGHLLPAACREHVVQQLSQQALPLFDASRLAVASELTLDARRRAVEQLAAHLDQLEREHAEFLQNADKFGRSMLQKRKEALLHDEALAGSDRIIVPGPSKDDILAGVMNTLRVGDTHELADHLLPQWEERLRMRAQHHYRWLPPDAPIGKLLTQIAATELADEFEQLFTDALGEGHSFYELIAQYGIDRLADGLLERSAHLVGLRGRDSEVFNVVTTDQTVVRLPPTIGAADGKIQAALARAFEERLQLCTVIESPSRRPVVCVSRYLLGFPWGLMDDNTALLRCYQRSAALGHLPQLVGEHPASLAGEPIAQLLRLAAFLFDRSFAQRVDHDPIHSSTR